MSKEHDQLITKFKELESIIKDQYEKTVYEFEDTLSDSEKKQLQLIRLERNFIQHENNYESFVAVSKGQIVFLEELINRIKLEDGTVKDAMISIAKFGSCSTDDTLVDVAKTLCAKKSSHIVLLDAKTGCAIGFVTDTMITNIIGAGGKLAVKIGKWQEIADTNYECIEQSTPYDDVCRNVGHKYIVTNKAWKPVGVLIIK